VANDETDLHTLAINGPEVRQADHHRGAVGVEFSDKRQFAAVVARDQSTDQRVRHRRHDGQKTQVTRSRAQMRPQLANRCIVSYRQDSDANALSVGEGYVIVSFAESFAAPHELCYR